MFGGEGEEFFGFVVAVVGHEDTGADGEVGGFCGSGLHAVLAEGVGFFEVFFATDPDVGDSEPGVDHAEHGRGRGRFLLEGGAGDGLDFVPFSFVGDGDEDFEGLEGRVRAEQVGEVAAVSTRVVFRSRRYFGE